MHLSPREIEALLTHQVGFLSQKRLARGLRLNLPETIGLIASQVQEFARDGICVSKLMDVGRQLLGRRQVMQGVTNALEEIQVEATFPDGTKLVTVHSPICRENGNLDLALHGSFLPVPELHLFDRYEKSYDRQHQSQCSSSLGRDDPELGETTYGDLSPIRLNVGRPICKLTVTSVCDRPIQVGSHYPFLETNKALIFDRERSYGLRLNIPAGTAVRFEPGETKEVNLVEIGGDRIIRGGNGLCDGVVDRQKIPRILKKVKERKFGHKPQIDFKPGRECLMPRTLYARNYGPTVGDKVRLADMSLVIEVEKDYTVYGEELKFGGGKVLRDGMGQKAQISCHDVLDTVITNALIIDAKLGIVKADVGIKGCVIQGIGKAGNPDVMSGVTAGMLFGAGTEVIAGENMILTSGALDGHVHFICPQLATEAIAAGITTLFGGGTGPAAGTCATTCSPGPNHIKMVIQSTDAFPLNFGFTGKGNTSQSEGLSKELVEQIEAGAIGLKLHEDWGTTPATIDAALRVAKVYDVQVMIHTDTLNESSCVEDTVEAIEGRTIHTYHTEGAGGGHAPDILRLCGEPNVLPSSTNPTRPYTINTVEEHLDMLMVCHHLDKNLKEDIAFAESRIRAETIAAEDILHDMGAISMISSDSQAMGRIGEVITRTWQTADKMKLLRGRLAEEIGNNDNIRVRRYVAKYTINPAISNGMAHLIGSVEVGKLADLVLWKPAYFGAKPQIVIKGGQIAWAQMGMPNASIPTPQPVKQRKMFGSYGGCIANNSVIFVSKLAVESCSIEKYKINKKVEAVFNCNNVRKSDMVLNDCLPKLKIDPETYKVTMLNSRGGSQKPEHLTCPPSNCLSLAQRYFLF